MIIGSYYCLHTYNQQPTCHYPTSHYPPDTMGYCNNLLFLKYLGRYQFFLESFRASRKHSFSPFVCLNYMIVHKYMINTELYLTIWKYVNKLLLEKNLDKSANITMNSHTNQQSFQSTGNLMLQSALIPTKIDFYQIFLNIVIKILKVLPFKKEHLLSLYIFRKKYKNFFCAQFLLLYILKRLETFVHAYFLFFWKFKFIY